MYAILSWSKCAQSLTRHLILHELSINSWGHTVCLTKMDVIHCDRKYQQFIACLGFALDRPQSNQQLAQFAVWK